MTKLIETVEEIELTIDTLNRYYEKVLPVIPADHMQDFEILLKMSKHYGLLESEINERRMRPRGYWLIDAKGLRCDLCGCGGRALYTKDRRTAEYYATRWKRCPYCGAKMSYEPEDKPKAVRYNERIGAMKND